MERNEPLGADHRNPTFPAPFVTKPVVTQGINRYQMKDLDMVFQQIPLALVYCRSSGIDTTASQSQAFFEILKLTIFNLRLKSIQKATNEDFWMKLKAGKTLNIKFSKYEKSSLISITILKLENWTFVKTGKSWDFSDIIVREK